MKTLITIIVLIAIGWGAYALFNKAGNNDALPAPVTNEMPVPGTETPEMIVETENVKEFVVAGTPFAFNPNRIEVNRGDRVRIVFQNKQGTHDWVIDEFATRTKVTQAGQSETVEFVADKGGSFEYYCSVGTHREMGMKGTLMVK